MSKRAAEASQREAEALKGGERPEKADKNEDVGEFEDEFEDEFESEDEIIEAGVDGRPDEEREAEERNSTSACHLHDIQSPPFETDLKILDAMDMDQQIFIPGRHKLGAGEMLSPDESAYEMLHSFSTAWPCLSFDIVRDS